MTTRYDQLLHLIDKLHPRTIFEVGVHRGLRASAMLARAGQHGPCSYIGYDVFETKDAAFQTAAMNGKGIARLVEAEERLRNVRRGMPPGRVDWRLVVGDTRETLHGRIPNCQAPALAFIDGDHRVECIRKDYEALSTCDVVVFDDYYVPDATGKTVDLALFGANAVVAELEHMGLRVEILPASDPCKHGGEIRLAVVRK